MPRGINLDVLSRDVALLLNCVRQEEISLATARQVTKSACFWASDLLGKKDRCPWWSEQALARRLSAGRWSADLQLIHEHVIPRKYLQAQLLDLDSPTAAGVESILLKSFCCIVTKEEDEALKVHRQSMPIDWDGLDQWARYANVARVNRPPPLQKRPPPETPSMES